MHANYLINALAADDKDEAQGAFEAMMQDRLADYLEVRKVELASTIMDDLQEGEGMDAQRRWVRQVAAIGKEGGMKPMHRQELKKAARAYGKKYAPHNAEFVDHGASQIRQVRKDIKRVNKAFGEEVLDELSKKTLGLYAAKATGEIAGRASTVGYVVGQHAERGSDDKEDIVKDIEAAGGKNYGHKLNRRVKGVTTAISKLTKEEALEEGGPTRKHFQQVADLIKEIPDAAKRKELAQHHAGIFKGQNPRFDHARFYKAAGVNEEVLDEVLQGGSKNASAAPSNAALNRNVMTNIRRAMQTLRLKGVNPAAAAAGHRDFAKLAAKSPKTPGYMLMRKLNATKGQALQSLTQAGVPLGSALEAHPNEFGQALQRIKRFK